MNKKQDKPGNHGYDFCYLNVTFVKFFVSKIIQNVSNDVPFG